MTIKNLAKIFWSEIHAQAISQKKGRCLFETHHFDLLTTSEQLCPPEEKLLHLK